MGVVEDQLKQHTVRKANILSMNESSLGSVLSNVVALEVLVASTDSSWNPIVPKFRVEVRVSPVTRTVSVRSKSGE